MADNVRETLKSLLSEAEVAEVGAVLVQVAPDIELDLISLLEAWRLHVDKLEHDLDLPDVDRSAWGVHDLVAALSLRDFVADGAAVLNSSLEQKVVRLLVDIDRRFKSYTENDTARFVLKIAERSQETRWWWHRIPVRGPVRREIEQICGQ